MGGKMKVIKICPYCKNTFTTDKNAKKFCRKRCAYLYNKKTEKAPKKHLCQRCGHIFTATRKRKFCSEKCHSLYMRDIGLLRKSVTKIPVKITLTDADKLSKEAKMSYGKYVRLYRI